jgi:hypothetical protein
MWYIGVILLFYLTFAVLSFIAKDDLLKFSVGALILFIGLNILQIAGYLDAEAIPLYFVFITGVLLGKILLKSPPPTYIAPGWVVAGSYAAFAVYLFQFQILALWSALLLGVHLPVTILTVICGFPLIFMIGYFIQCWFDILVKKCVGPNTQNN